MFFKSSDAIFEILDLCKRDFKMHKCCLFFQDIVVIQRCNGNIKVDNVKQTFFKDVMLLG